MRYHTLLDRNFDLIVIGGGILGCGIARDAALRGLSVVLFEQEDFGAGTSSRSTRLIHGGLRYLEQLDFGLVRQDLRERECLLRTAPHRVRPLPFLVPLYRRSALYRARLRAGMVLYDLLSYDKSLPHHRFLSRKETLKVESSLNPNGLQGAALYYDAQCAYVERLCLDNVIDAVSEGALIFNHTAVTGLIRTGGRVTGVQIEDRLTAETGSAHAECVVNAAGPWLDSLLSTLTAQPTQRLRLTKGVHFAAPPAGNYALVLFAPTDERLFFVIPWLDYSWVGTTDTDFSDDPGTAHATGEDIRYLLAGVGPILPHADWNTIYFTSAGVRSLVSDNRPNRPASGVSRKHRLVRHTAEEGLEGMLSVLGGKITAYRDIARETVEAAYEIQQTWRAAQAKRDGLRPHRVALPKCRTMTCPLPGGEFKDRAQLEATIQSEAQAVGLSPEQANRLTILYGTRAQRLIDRVRASPELGAPIAVGYPDILAEIVYAVENEYALTAADFILRRSLLGFSPDQGEVALEAVISTMSGLLGWPQERQEAERAACLAHIASCLAFRTEMQGVGCGV